MPILIAWIPADWSSLVVFRVGETNFTAGSLTASAVILVATAVVARWSRYAVRRAPQHLPSMQPNTAYLLSRILFYAIWGLGAFLALSTAGVDLSSLTIIGGALGIGIGFGLQSIVSNFVSGLILLVDRSLKVGDFIELEDGRRGIVSDISMRCTRVQTNDNVDILVPNSEFITGKIINYTHAEEERRLRIPFGVAYGSDKEVVKAAALAAAAQVPYTVTDNPERAPRVWLSEFGDSSLNFHLVVWIKAHAARKQSGIIAEYNWALETQLRKYGLEIPFPQRDLHLRSGWPLESLSHRQAREVE